MDVDNCVGIDCTSVREQTGWRGQREKNWNNCSSINNETLKNERKEGRQAWLLGVREEDDFLYFATCVLLGRLALTLSLVTSSA